MNPSRLLAAMAASAVGFAVTLVGVTLADSGDDAPVAVETPGSVGVDQDAPVDDEGSVDADADQEIVAVEEPDEAEVDADLDTTDTSTDSDTDTDDGGSVVAEESDEAETESVPVAEESADADRTPTDSVDGQRTERPTADCFDVVVLDDGDGTVLRKGDEYQLVEGEFELLDDLDIDVRFLVDLDEISIAVDDGVIVSCSDGRIIEVAPLVDFFVTAPCEGEVREYFDEFFASLPVSDEAGFTDEEVFVEVVAERLERVNSTTDRIEEFLDAVDATFAGFTDDCSSIVSTSDLESSEFFCAAGNLSASDELLGYLGAQLGSLDCEYDA